MAQAKAKGKARTEEASSAPPRCSVAFCPICMVVTAMGDARPDLMDHLLAASREMLLALRALVDARLQGTEPPARLERLTIE
jgi:hypothetical protein